MYDLKALEVESAHISGQIDGERAAKRDSLAEVVEAERQIMLWERKIILEKEMQEVLDPTVGQDVVGEMKKEIHRMELRHGELMKLQEKLMGDLEKALNKREVVAVKGRATQARTKMQPQDATMTRSQLDKAVLELHRSIRDTEAETQATDSRLHELEARRADVEAQLSELDSALASSLEREEAELEELAGAAKEKYKLLLATARLQKKAKRLEDLESGKVKPTMEDPSLIESEMSKVKDKVRRIVEFIQEVKEVQPELSSELEKILCHV